MGILGFLAVILCWIFFIIFGIMALGFIFGCLVNTVCSSSSTHDDDND